MQQTHPTIWEMRQVVAVYLPAGSSVEIVPVWWSPITYRTMIPVYVARNSLPEPIHFGGCI
jgi:hypothetical protein